MEIVNLYPPIAVGVETVERFSYLVENDARAHEAVERDARCSPRLRTTNLWCRWFHVLDE